MSSPDEGRLQSGGHGGHNGLRSLIDVCKSKSFARLKLGVGRPADGVPVHVHVLTSFEPVRAGASLSPGKRVVPLAELYDSQPFTSLYDGTYPLAGPRTET